MEIPVIDGLSDFDASIGSLSAANPPLISRLLSIFEVGMYWKWGALLVALIYALGSVVRRIKIMFVQRHHRRASKIASSEPVLACSDGDENDDVRSSEGEAEEGRDLDATSSSYENPGGFYEDFRVKNSCDQKRKFRIGRRRSLAGDSSFPSLAELVSGKGVVELWEGLRFGIDLGEADSPDADSISIFDMDKGVMMGSIVGQIPSVSVSPSSPRVVFTASGGGDGRVGLCSWDMRMRRRSPAAEADWPVGPRSGPFVEVKAGGVDKVYVRGDVSGSMTVRDMRKAGSPLLNVTEYDGGRWFRDSNAVSQTEE